MWGGGTYVSQNKTLPGAYINFFAVDKVSAVLGERGTVAIALPLNFKAGSVIEITRAEFVNNSKEILGKDMVDESLIMLREIFQNASKCYIYDLGTTHTASDAILALEQYEFNVLCVYTDEAEDITQYIMAVKSWRDEAGKKCQAVVYNQNKPDHEGIINVTTSVERGEDSEIPAYALVAWVAGVEAGCEVNKSCMNRLYNGEYEVVTNKSQTELETAINNGEFVFHKVYGEVRVLKDINSLTTTTLEKSDDFKSNQVIRVIDLIGNDTAKLFNKKYLGQIPNDVEGRTSFWADIVAHRKELEKIRAIHNYKSDELIVEEGKTKESVVVYELVEVTTAMGKLYMTIYVG